jgi:hypothetical protein
MAMKVITPCDGPDHDYSKDHRPDPRQMILAALAW